MNINSIKCSACGCSGIHACMGAKSKPWTDEKNKELIEAMKRVKELRNA